MSATIIKAEQKGITVQVFIPIPAGKENMSMFEREELIQQGINQAGQLATEYALSQFDTDGAPITVNDKKHTSKGQVSKAGLPDSLWRGCFVPSCLPDKCRRLYILSFGQRCPDHHKCNTQISKNGEQ